MGEVTWLTFACPKCGELYRVAPHHWRIGYGRYCSMYCRIAQKRRLYYGRG